MKKNLTFYSIVSILLSISFLVISCKKKEESKEKETTPAAELKVAAVDGFSDTYIFPNSIFKPGKEELSNGDIILHPEIFLKGRIPDEKSTYDVTLMTDYYEDVDVEYCKYAVTAISPDSASRRTQQYKINFKESQQDKVISTEGGRTLKRNTCKIFQGMKFSSVGEARFKIELAPGHGRFTFTGIHSISVRVERVKE